MVDFPVSCVFSLTNRVCFFVSTTLSLSQLVTSNDFRWSQRPNRRFGARHVVGEWVSSNGFTLAGKLI